MTGKRIRNYQLEENLGEGGMGVVYRARDLSLGRMVAIKMLHPEMLHQPDLLKRFKNEAHVTAHLSHPNIATLYNFFSDGDHHCLVMEYVNGKTLEQILSVHKKIPADECIRILMQLLEGLEEAHQNEVLHRDIKPGNVMMNRAGYIKLMDFGVARFESSARITRMNRVIGTLEYMAPELLTGGQPSRQTDLYSAGVAAFEMVTGRLPFDTSSDTDLMERIMQGKFSFPVESSSSLFKRQSKLNGIIQKLMHKKASKRYQSCREVLNDLSGLGVSGRVSANSLLADIPQHSSAETKSIPEKQTLQNIKSILHRLESAAVSFYPFWEKKKPFTDQLNKSSSTFLKTTEGKIIGGALLLAMLILLISSVFTSSAENERGIPEDNVLQIHTPTSSPRSVEHTTEENSTISNHISTGPNRTPTVNTVPKPDEIIIPGREPRNQPESTPRGSGSVLEGNPQPEPIREENNTQEPVLPDTSEVPEENDEPENLKEEIEPTADRTHEEESAPGRQIEVFISNLLVEGIFNETVSTTTHTTGQKFYLTAARDVYYDGYRVINAGARIRGVVNDVRIRGGSRRATLAVQFDAVQAVDGSWLPVTYPEYSDRGTGSVAFERGRTINRLRVESGKVTLIL